jgi:hypothetical protein
MPHPGRASHADSCVVGPVVKHDQARRSLQGGERFDQVRKPRLGVPSSVVEGTVRLHQCSVLRLLDQGCGNWELVGVGELVGRETNSSGS